MAIDIKVLDAFVSQGTNYSLTKVVKIEGTYKVKVSVVRDYYQSQSSASVSLLTPDGWKFLLETPPDSWFGGTLAITSLVREPLGRKVEVQLGPIADELISRAANILVG